MMSFKVKLFCLVQLSADRNMTIKDMVQGISGEFGLDTIQVRTLPGKSPVNLDAAATTVENGEIAIENSERKLSNFELDNVYKSKFCYFVIKELLIYSLGRAWLVSSLLSNHKVPSSIPGSAKV